ncbi:hypothetical protein SKAU_G00135030 [Synaphobranchus kaupii]|uniref:Reverse transcriptase n=1 Tax=Synaphobranchus kaupii TaxID=118154 RepID=A0A9Q1FRA0_SYNKA|nr:hypothetical protein SKAU_G00135030 [Synaphobranchus kaupii]
MDIARSHEIAQAQMRTIGGSATASGSHDQTVHAVLRHTSKNTAQGARFRQDGAERDFKTSDTDRKYNRSCGYCVVVEKLRTGKLRVCLDPRDLNKAVKRPHYRLPTLEDVTPKLAAQDEFQRKIDETYQGLDGVVAIVDDVLLYGATQEEHDRNLRAMLQ